MSRLRVVGLGAGGHAAVVLDVLRSQGGVDIIGLLDPNPELWRTTVEGVAVLGDDSLLPSLKAEGIGAAFLGLGGTGDTRPRQRLYRTALDHGFVLVSAIHPSAVVGGGVRFGVGPTIMAGACVNSGTVCGDDVIVNTGAVVEHHCVIGAHVHVATGACLGGGVHVGDGSHVGLGAAVIQGVRIGSGVIVGAGAVVVRDVPDHVTVVGVPARVTREHSDDR